METTHRAPSIRSTTTDYFGRATSSRGPTDLTPHLSQAPEFRVPTHEAPQKVLTPRWSTPSPHSLHAIWERDDHVSECRECRRRFTFLNRRVSRFLICDFSCADDMSVARMSNQLAAFMPILTFLQHCRRCGRIFCDRCSSYRVLLDPSDIVHDPSFPEATPGASQQRVCQNCYEEVTATIPNGLSASRTNSLERIFIDQRRLNVPSPTRAQSSSQLSDLAE